MNDFCCPFEALFFSYSWQCRQEEEGFLYQFTTRDAFWCNSIKWKNSDAFWYNSIKLKNSWNYCVAPQNMAEIFVHWKSDWNFFKQYLVFYIFKGLLMAWFTYLFWKKNLNFWTIFWSLCCFYRLSRIHLFCWFHSLPSLSTLLVSFQIYYLMMFLP